MSSEFRIMLGDVKENPHLLVIVAKTYDPSHFKFTVINGAWDGEFHNGNITVWGCPGGSYSTIDKSYRILCDDQMRLRGDYNMVFENFHDVMYVAPVRETINFSDIHDSIYDDDITF